VRVAQRFSGYTLLEVGLKTGRTHQIRVHLADAGHAIVGDDKYGDRDADRALARGAVLPGCRFERMFLHARGLSFHHPASGEPMTLEAPLPPACVRLLAALPAAPDRGASAVAEGPAGGARRPRTRVSRVA
jgi:23S rRNA pseudouridine955/2504/2580 synthase